MPLRVLVTRPTEDAKALVDALEARGHRALVEPLLTIKPVTKPEQVPDLDRVQALLFTSANGLRAFAARSGDRNLPVYTVGDASAAAARSAGFQHVESAGGDLGDLVRLVTERLDPARGILYHGTTDKRAGDLKGGLEAAGFEFRRALLYRARAAKALTKGLRGALAEGALDAVTFFSPRSAETFVSLARRADLGAACARLHAVCLSAAVAAKLGELSWSRVWIAERPDQEALLACLDQIVAPESGEPTAAMPEIDDHPLETPGSESESVPSPAGKEASAKAESAMGIIARFGGIRPMASKVGVAVSTVQGWRERGSIPAARHREILAVAERHGIAIEAAELAAGIPHESPPAPQTHSVQPPPQPVLAHRPEAREPEPVETATPARGPSALGPALRGAVLGVLVVALGATGAMLTRELWLPLFGSPPAADPGAQRLADLEGGLAALEARVGGLESRPASTSGEAPGFEALRRNLADQNRRLDGLATRLDQAAAGEAAETTIGADLAELRGALDRQIAALAQRVETLDQRIRTTGATDPVTADPGAEENSRRLAELSARLDALADLEGEVAALAARVAAGLSGAGGGPAAAGDAALAIAVLQLRDAVRGAGPFGAEFQLARDLFAGLAPSETGAAMAEVIAPLAPYAAKGVASLAALRAGFPAIAREIVAPAQGAADESWIAGLLRQASRLVTIRPQGAVEGADPGAVVARTEAHLAAGDLAAAVAELAALEGRAAAAAEPWRTEAEGRLIARRVLSALGQRLAARLAPAPEPKPGG